MNYSNWDPDQPDNEDVSDGSNDDCVQHLYRLVEKTFAWFDTSCERKRDGMICENNVTV